MINWPPYIATPQDIPGWTTTDQHNCYKKLISLLPKNPRVLEIGCGWGRSTWAWLDILPSDSNFYILDFFKLDYKSLLKTRINDSPLSRIVNSKGIKRIRKRNISQREIFDTIIKQHPKNSLIKQVWHMDGTEWKNSSIYTTNWDLVFLDDDHNYFTVSDWLERFKNVPIICGDDYSIYQSGVKNAVDDYAKKTNCTKEILPGCFWVLKNNVNAII